MQTHVMEEHYPRCQHSMPFVLNGPMWMFHKPLLPLLWSLVARIPPSADLTCPLSGRR
jgi:hypothetical protein